MFVKTLFHFSTSRIAHFGVMTTFALLHTKLVPADCLPWYSLFVPWSVILIRCTSVLSELANACSQEPWFSQALQKVDIHCSLQNQGHLLQ